MNAYPVKIKSIKRITHDVLQIITDKPIEYGFKPGQATSISINNWACDYKKSPFTFTSLPYEKYLEFIIKTYPAHESVTDELLDLKLDDELLLHEVFGAIRYKGEGVFIAGGAGITPFISIFRQLKAKNEIGNNKLIYANKKKEDIILEKEFKELLGDNFINILSDEITSEYANGHITESFLKSYINRSTKNVYVCGPPKMMESINMQLSNIGVYKKKITMEEI